MISVDEAVQRITAAFAPLETETVSLTDAPGRVLAEDAKARLDQPPFPVSAMDGYAVRARDAATVPVTLRVIGEAPAGHPFKGALGAGEAVRIFTGGVVPGRRRCDRHPGRHGAERRQGHDQEAQPSAENTSARRDSISRMAAFWRRPDKDCAPAILPFWPRAIFRPCPCAAAHAWHLPAPATNSLCPEARASPAASWHRPGTD